MIKIYFRILKVCWKIYGPGKVFFEWLIAEPLMRLFTFSTLLLDNIFFPGYRRVEVKNPVFIIGHPRSGTTFLHHLLSRTGRTAAFKCWHIFFPALTARALVKPLMHRLIKKGKSEVMPVETGHHMALEKVEEEEMLFLNNYDTQFIGSALLALDDREYPELQFHDQQPDRRRFRSLRFLHGCFQRQIHYTSRPRIIAQTHFSTHRLKTIMEFYPDAKFIYIVRDPQEVIPSYLSLLHKSIDFRWGLAKIPDRILARYNERRYQAAIALYRYFYDLRKNGEIPEDRVLVMPYPLLLSDLRGAFEKIVDFTGIAVSDELREIVSRQAAQQKDYRRRHEVYDLARFGLSRERISRDFAFVYEEHDSLNTN